MVKNRLRELAPRGERRQVLRDEVAAAEFEAMVGASEDRYPLAPMRTDRGGLVCPDACLYRNEWVVAAEDDKRRDAQPLEILPWVVRSPDADLVPRGVVEAETLRLGYRVPRFALEGVRLPV
jgi:hypothetical protein